MVGVSASNVKVAGMKPMQIVEEVRVAADWPTRAYMCTDHDRMHIRVLTTWSTMEVLVVTWHVPKRKSSPAHTFEPRKDDKIDT
ncbi:hypothetical protein TNCV_4261671 [Trichonephila clavipes]|nr:hypothetical protein TNCV_4261671 [Trichonephila clavipes]